MPAGKQAGAPDISPDGTTIAYVSNEGADNFSVWTMNIDGSGQHKLFGRGGFDFLQPRWSPDGTKLVVTRCDSSVGLLTNCDIVLTKRDGTRLRTRSVRLHQHRYQPANRTATADHRERAATPARR